MARAATVGYLGTDLSMMVNALAFRVSVTIRIRRSRAIAAVRRRDCAGRHVLRRRAALRAWGSLAVRRYQLAQSMTITGGARARVLAGGHPKRDDFIVVSLAAPGMEVLTPLVRPFFGCNGAAAHCNVRLGSTALMRYEGR